MVISTVSSRGQTVIPKSIRDYLGIKPGDRVDFVLRSDGEVIIKPATQDVRKLKGLLHRPGKKPVSLDEMRHAIRSRGGRI